MSVAIPNPIVGPTLTPAFGDKGQQERLAAGVRVGDRIWAHDPAVGRQKQSLIGFSHRNPDCFWGHVRLGQR